MRILQWSECFLPDIGGAEVLLSHLLRALRARGHELCLVTGRSPQAPEAQTDFEGVPVHHFDFRSALQAGDLRSLKAQADAIAALKAAFRPDVVHVQLYGPSPLLERMSRRAWPAPRVVTLHTALEAAARGDSVLRSLLRDADAVVALSQAMRTRIVALEPALAGRTSVVPNGLQEMRAAAPLPFAPATLLCLGRLIPEKGFDLALRAAQRLARKMALQVLVAGDGPERPALERLAAELGIAPLTRFLGFVDPECVPELIDQATVVVVPSRWEEPSACVIREAAGMARPVVASRVGGTPELIEDGATGLLFPSENVDGLAAALAALLCDPGRARRLGEAARERVRGACSFADFVSSYEALYRRVVGEHLAAAS